MAALLLLLLSCFSRVRLCNPIDGSPPGSSIPGILQARTLERVAISFSSEWKWKVKVKSLSQVQLLATPWTAAHQAPPSMGFSRQEYWSGLPLPSPLLQMTNRHMERCSKTTNYYRDANQNYITPVRMAMIKMSTKNKCWGEHEEKRNFLKCWWECRLLQPLWKTAWRLLKTRSRVAIWFSNPTLNIYPEKNYN